MFLNLLGQRSAPAQFLVAYAGLSSRSVTGGHLTFTPERGTISRLGFAKDFGSGVFGCAPPAEPAAKGQFYTDKFIEIRAGNERESLGRAKLKEAYVHDFHYRCDIDFTGLHLVLMLQQSAFEQYERFIGTACVPASVADPGAWHANLLVLIPAPLFEFPAGRGSVPPYPPAETREAKVGKLRMIRNFRFDSIDILKITRDASGDLCVPDLLNIQSDQLLRLP